MYDGIIFDMDGTIWDSRETIVKAWNDELKAQGIDRVITVSELTGYMGLTMDAIAEGLHILPVVRIVSFHTIPPALFYPSYRIPAGKSIFVHE